MTLVRLRAGTVYLDFPEMLTEELKCGLHEQAMRRIENRVKS